MERTEEFITDEEGNRFEKSVLIMEITSMSPETRDEVISGEIQGKKVELVRFCFQDRSIDRNF